LEVAAQADLFTPAISRLSRLRLSDPQTIIRDASLKPGLNIIWTPDMSSSGSSALAHGSGKTTFCRHAHGC
jgi:hypothetical protein